MPILTDYCAISKLKENNMSISKDQLRKKTLEPRVQLHELIQSGMKEIDAIDKVFPTKDARGRRINSNRMAKLRLWIRHNLWPVSDRDLSEAGSASQETPSATRIEKLGDVIMHVPRRRSFLTGEESKPPRTENMSFRIPVEMVNELKKLHGTNTEHVVSALSAYLEHKDKIESGLKS